ncbi:hypothetical protein [Mycolicibacterium goodii]|uniref:hypothetical protein n=1 Tax=Mycolicibacterium goodii TaxID=134601 RepID=UPI00296E5E07
MLAIALAVVVTVLVTRPNDGKDTAGRTPLGPDAQLASAGDTGPVSIITDDPTCDAWNTVAGESASVTNSVKWDDRDTSIPASAWTDDQRAMYDRVATAMTRAADQAEGLVTQTPHRVIRELYEQFIAYTRAFVETVPSYVPADNNLTVAASGAGNGLANLCGAIRYRSAQAVAPLVPGASNPSYQSRDDERTTTLLLTDNNPICGPWNSLVSKFSEDTRAWREIDKNISAADWTPEQKAMNDQVAPVMLASADEMERLGRESGSPALEDIAILAAQYRRGFVASLPTYTSADSYLELTTTNLVRLINWACKAVS